MDKKIKFIIVILVFCLQFTNVYAEDAAVKDQINMLDLNNIKQTVESLKSEANNEYVDQFNFEDIFNKVITGKFDISFPKIIDSITKAILNEFYLHISLIGKLIVVAVLCALLKILNESFENKAVGEIGFYVCYVVIIILVFQTFQVAAKISKEAIESMVLIMQAFIPIFITLLISSGKIVTATVFEPMTIMGAETIGILVKNVFLPIIFFIAVLEIINYISEKQFLQQWVELFKKVVQWGLKGMLTLFLGMISIERLTTPVLDATGNKGIKFMAKTFMPVIGDILTSAVDTVLNSAVLIKNAVGVVGIVILVLICFAPIVKLIVLILVYKLAAAIIQPISETRVVKCMNSASSFCSLLLGCIFTIAVMFIITTAMIMSIGV